MVRPAPRRAVELQAERYLAMTSRTRRGLYSKARLKKAGGSMSTLLAGTLPGALPTISTEMPFSWAMALTASSRDGLQLLDDQDLVHAL